MFSLGTQFLRFATSGAVGTGFHYLVLILLVELTDIKVVVATLVGFLVGAVTNYALARRFVFKSTRTHTAALPRFLFVATVGAVINTALVKAVNDLGVHYIGAQVFATGVTLIWNFVANRVWTFRG